MLDLKHQTSPLIYAIMWPVCACAEDSQTLDYFYLSKERSGSTVKSCLNQFLCYSNKQSYWWHLFLHQSVLYAIEFCFHPLFIFSECTKFVMLNIGQSVLCFWPINPFNPQLVVFIKGQWLIVSVILLSVLNRLLSYWMSMSLTGDTSSCPSILVTVSLRLCRLP